MALSKIYNALVSEEGRKWIEKYRHRLVTVFLVLGFLSDIIIFHAIDVSLAQIILLTHLLVVAFSLIALSANRIEGGIFSRMIPWIPLLHQYSVGALLSAFLVLYSASASLVSSWPFFALVAVAAIANETLRLQKYWLPFHTTIFFLSLLLCTALSVPILLNSIGVGTFLISVVVGAGLFFVFMRVALFFAPVPFWQNRFLIRAGCGVVLGAMMLLYFTNLIPPIPLSLTTAGAYHFVERVGGDYVAQKEPTHWLQNFFSFRGDRVRLTEGSPVYVFTAVFAPADLETNIVHRWQYYSEERERWETRQTIPFPIIGGRDGGYRGYSLSESPVPGRWRVLVETGRGQVVGQVFFVVEYGTSPVFTTESVL